jgi:hypothetical protein
VSPFDRVFVRFNRAKIERHRPEATSDPWSALLLREGCRATELDALDPRSPWMR